jgi:hypothetical protein
MSMTLRQARLVDPVLTRHVRGYRNGELAGMALFPAVDVPTAGGQVIEFGREAFVRYAARRAPGSDTKRVPFGHFGQPYRLVNEALDAAVPREMNRDVQEVADVDLGMRATNVVMRSLMLGLEIDQAALARNPASYPAANKTVLSGTSQWSDFAGGVSNPLNNVDAGMEAVRLATGMYPNVALLPAPVYRVARRHPALLNTVDNKGGALSPEQLANIFGVRRVVVAGAVQASGAEPLTEPMSGTFTDIWGKDVILAYAPEEPGGVEEPSFGYTYRMIGHPFVEQARWDGDAKSWIYGVNYERVPLLTGVSAGYLIQNAIA